jgi:hypothetical protein
VPAAARVCRFCGHRFERERRFARVPRALSWIVVTVVGAAIATSASLVGPDVYHHFFHSLTHTSVMIMRPAEAERLVSGVEVAARERGDCTQRSNADYGNPQAIRCYARGGAIHDPCFEFDARRLVCAQAPWDNRVTVVTATSDVASSDAPLKQQFPWALELKGGDRCVLVTGATFTVAGLRANYGCERGKGWVFGDPDRSHDLWYVFFARERSTNLRRVAVRVAWY